MMNLKTAKADGCKFLIYIAVHHNNVIQLRKLIWFLSEAAEMAVAP